MLWTGLIAAAVVATASPVTTQSQGAAAAPAASAAPSRANRADEVVCRNQAVTGSRFTHRRCRTRAQDRAAQQEASRFIGDSTRSGPSLEEMVVIQNGPSSTPL